MSDALGAFPDHTLTCLWKERPALMGIVNVTPDSFSDGGKYLDTERAVAHGLELLREGADILDIGGESTRPGASGIPVDEEIKRVVPVIKGLAGKAPYISIDTRHSETMEAALEAGANIINDISALSDDKRSIEVAAAAQVPVILMHKKGQPETMQEKPIYNNVVQEIIVYLKERISYCETHRIDENNLIIDPGIGFGKTLEHNLLILRNIKEFSVLDMPVMLGVSRKTFIGNLSRDEPPEERMAGSLATALWGLSQQAVQIVRVHDVKETRQAFSVFQAFLQE